MSDVLKVIDDWIETHGSHDTHPGGVYTSTIILSPAQHIPLSERGIEGLPDGVPSVGT
jgi:hypothetical protein